jgi:F0F1-type ATP synthase membrane subunit b/b'
MFQIDGTLIVIFVSFLVFMGLMKVIFFDPIMTIKDTRDQTIETEQKAAEVAAMKKTQLSQEYDNQLVEARRKALQLVQEKREWAKKQAAERVSSVREKANQETEQQTTLLKESREKIYQSLQAQRDEFARSIIEKLSGREKSATGASSSPSAVL